MWRRSALLYILRRAARLREIVIAVPKKERYWVYKEKILGCVHWSVWIWYRIWIEVVKKSNIDIDMSKKKADSAVHSHNYDHQVDVELSLSGIKSRMLKVESRMLKIGALSVCPLWHAVSNLNLNLPHEPQVRAGSNPSCYYLSWWFTVYSSRWLQLVAS